MSARACSRRRRDAAHGVGLVRFTPWNTTRSPFTRNRSPRSTPCGSRGAARRSRRPARPPASVPVETVASYRLGTSALHGSTPSSVIGATSSARRPRHVDVELRHPEAHRKRGVERRERDRSRSRSPADRTPPWPFADRRGPAGAERTRRRSAASVGASRVTLRKMPGSTTGPGPRGTRPPTTGAPARAARSTRARAGRSRRTRSRARDPGRPTPTREPFSPHPKCDSTPSKRSSTRAAPSNVEGTSNVRRWSPVGFSSGGCGGSIGTGTAGWCSSARRARAGPSATARGGCPTRPPPPGAGRPRPATTGSPLPVERQGRGVVCVNQARGASRVSEPGAVEASAFRAHRAWWLVEDESEQRWSTLDRSFREAPAPEALQDDDRDHQRITETSTPPVVSW